MPDGHSDKVNLAEKLALFSDTWRPRIVGELNGQHVKLCRLEGEFVWHQHESEDELFLVLDGQLDIELRDRVISLERGEFFIPVAAQVSISDIWITSKLSSTRVI